MFRIFHLTAVFLLGLGAAAQTGSTPPNANGPDGPNALYKLEGTVVNAETGQPVPRALVQIHAEGKKAVLTNAQGEFSFDKLHPTNTMVQVEKPGFYDPGNFEQRSLERYVEVGPQTGKVVVKLEPECVISGEVVNDDGEPVEGAAIEAFAFRIVEGRRELKPVSNSVLTNEDGVFRMGDLSAGRYFVSVKPGSAGRRILGAQSGTSRQSYPLVVYYPAATDTASATPLELSAGQHAHVQFSLALAPALRLAGTVSAIAGFKRVSPPMIVDAAERPLLAASHWDNQTGAFEFPALPPGTHTLRIYGMSDGTHNVGLQQNVVLNRDLTDLNLTLGVGATIPVAMRVESSPGSEPGCTGGFAAMGKIRAVSDQFDCTKFSAMVTLASAESHRMQFHAETESDPPRLVFHGVMPGKYRVEVQPMVQAYVGSVRSGATDLLQEEMIVPEGGNVPPIEVVLRTDSANVNVHVHAEPPLEHARILLLPEFAPYQRAVSLSTASNGESQASGLAPGDYKVLAFEGMGDVEYGNPEIMAKYASKTAHVRLAANGTAEVTVELIRAGE